MTLYSRSFSRRAATVVIVATLAVTLASCGSDGSGVISSLNGNDNTPEAVEYQPVTVGGTALAAQPDSGIDPAVGARAPTLTGASFDGTPVSVTPGKDGKLLLVFLAHWCPHCRAEVPLLVDWMKEGSVPSDVRIVAVSTSVTNTRPNFPPSDWLEGEQWSTEVMADSNESDAAAAYGLTGFPYFVLVSTDGTVAARVSGEIDPTELGKLLTSTLT